LLRRFLGSDRVMDLFIAVSERVDIGALQYRK
jgi:hypothetical protein